MGQRNNQASAQPGTYTGAMPAGFTPQTFMPRRPQMNWRMPFNNDPAQGAYDPNVSYAQGAVPGQQVNQAANVSRWSGQMQQMQPDWRYQRGGVY